MIKADKWIVELKGKKSLLVTEYSMLTHGLKEAIAQNGSEEEADYLLITAQQDGLRIPIEKEEEEKDEKKTDDLMEKVDKLIAELEKELTDGRDEN